ncbi:MAG: ArsR/SmtB family transcription factor, partial [Chitinispirillaceae bacterium]
MAEKLRLSMESFVSIAKALADTNRVRAFLALRMGELCVCQITGLLGLAPSTISKHMSILKQAGLVESRKDGRWVYYRMAERKNGTPMGSMIRELQSLLEDDDQIKNDSARMETIASQDLDALCKRQRGT